MSTRATTARVVLVASAHACAAFLGAVAFNVSATRALAAVLLGSGMILLGLWLSRYMRSANTPDDDGGDEVQMPTLLLEEKQPPRNEWRM